MRGASDFSSISPFVVVQTLLTVMTVIGDRGKERNGFVRHLVIGLTVPYIMYQLSKINSVRDHYY